MLFAAIALKSIVDTEDANDSENNADCWQVRCRWVTGNEDAQVNAH